MTALLAALLLLTPQPAGIGDPCPWTTTSARFAVEHTGNYLASMHCAPGFAYEDSPGTVTALLVYRATHR